MVRDKQREKELLIPSIKGTPNNLKGSMNFKSSSQNWKLKINLSWQRTMSSESILKNRMNKAIKKMKPELSNWLRRTEKWKSSMSIR